MLEEFKQYDAIIDSLTDQIAVIDETGTILFVNHAWIQFGLENGIGSFYNWIGTNYLKPCGASKDIEVIKSVAGITDVITGKIKHYHYEYPCHSLTEKRWFLMRIVPMFNNPKYFVISHVNVTVRKLAELQILNMASIDPLTSIPNRRRLEEFIQKQWFNGLRYKDPLSLLIIDIDNFKLLNDMFGHIFGDECLRRIAQCIHSTIRKVDLVARFGGEEFVVVLPKTNGRLAEIAANRILEAIRNMGIRRSEDEIVTVSIGISSVIPNNIINVEYLMKRADEALYKAKKSGKDKYDFCEIEIFIPNQDNLDVS